MLLYGSFEKARHYIETHSMQDPGRKYEFYPCVTISRETGAGADKVSELLLNFFENYKHPSHPAWAVFDKNLIKKVLEDHHLPMHLQKLMEEQKYPTMTLWITELLTGQPSAIELMHKTSETILNLARLGNVVIIGRGSNFITSKLKNSIHVRLVAPIDQRIKHIEELYQMSKKDAIEFIKKDDLERKRYIAAHFNSELENPLNYHLVINTGNVSYSEAAKIIGKTVIRKFSNVFPKSNRETILIK